MGQMCIRPAGADGLNNQIRDFRLLDFQVGLGFQDLTHLQPISLLVTLCPRGPDRRPARGIEQTELYAHRVRDLSHDAAEGIHLADKMSFGNAAYGRIAGHLRDKIHIEGVESSSQAHARRRHCRFTAGVPRADYDHIEFFTVFHFVFYSKSLVPWVRCCDQRLAIC